MLNVIGVKLKDYRESIPMILVMTVLALLLIYVFGRSFDGANLPKVAVVDVDGTGPSGRFVENLIDVEGFQYELVNYDEGLDGTSDSRYIAMVVIEDGFAANSLDGQGKLTMYKSGESIEHFTLQAAIESLGRRFYMEERFVEQLPKALKGYGVEVDQDELRQALAVQVAKYPILVVKTTSYGPSVTTGYDSLKHSFIGFILFFSMFTMVFGIGSIVDEKEHMVWQRQNVALVGMAKVMAGNMIASFMVGMLQLIVMVLVSRLIFGLDWGGSIVALLLVLAAFVLAVTAMGLFMSGLVSTMQQLGSFSPIVIVSTSMIGGCMWPLEIITSKILLFLADLTPQRWAYKGLKAVIINGGGLSDVTDALGMLLIIALVFFVLGMLPFRKGFSTSN